MARTKPQYGSDVIEAIASRYRQVRGHLNERALRIWAGAEANVLGFGGTRAVCQATGLDSKTVRRGRAEAADPDAVPTHPDAARQRAPGAGRKPVEEALPGVQQALTDLVEPSRRGDPTSALCWTSKSAAKLGRELGEQGFRVSDRSVVRMLHDMGFSLQSNRKRFEGKQHPDRDGQFAYLNAEIDKAMAAGDPVVSIDTKANEKVGNFVGKGQEWQPQGDPVEVNAYDFPSWADGKAIPLGVYDVAAREGWVSVGVTADTAQFSVATLRRWYEQMGQARYPEAKKLLVTADCGGSNRPAVRLWQSELQRFADETGLQVRVLHYPPGTSKWNKIEHQMWSQITLNWRGRPLTSYLVIIKCIENTTTKSGLRIRAEMDTERYETGVIPSAERMKSLQIQRDAYHGDWNYTVIPRNAQ